MLLEAYNLRKTFLRDRPLYKQIFHPFGKRQKVRALDSVSLFIDTGQILGVVGPNGAGKTTLLRILADVLEADEGTIKVLGQSIRKNGWEVRSRIGYVSSDERSFFWRLTGRENLEFFGRLYGLSRRQVKTQTAELLNQFGFKSKADHLFRDYSAGMKKKVSVIRALLHKPTLLLLDEVTNNLDPPSAKMVKDIVREYVKSQQSCAAIWSTHRLEEISQICDKAIMINSGRIISRELIEDFKSNSDIMSKYLLKLQNVNGRFEDFCKKICGNTTVRTCNKDNTNEFIISGISQKDFSRIVSLAVKDFGAYIIYAGCEKKDPDLLFERFNSGVKTCDGRS